MISDEVLLRAKQRLVDGFHPSKIILFRSQARGAAFMKTNGKSRIRAKPYV